MDQRTSKHPFALPRAEQAARRRGRLVPGGTRAIVIAVTLIVVAVIVWAVQPNPAPQRNRVAFFGANQVMPVGVATAAPGDIQVMLNALGTVIPLATVTVKPQVSGQLIKIDFSEGQMVQAGQVLAEIDPRPFQAALAQAQGQLAKDQALLANARVDLQRYRTLIAQNSIAQQQVDTQAALVRQYEAVVKTDQANVQAAEINVNYATIKSPITGRVGLRQVDVGNLVTAGQATGIVVVTELDPISVVFSVPEDSVGAIMNRVREGAKLAADAYDRAQQTKLATGTLETVDNQIDPTTGTVKLRALFENSKATLFPNQFVNIRLLVSTLHDQIVVPSAAIQRGTSGTFVYVVNADHTVAMRPVTLGQSQDDKVAIAKGVMPGEMVVVDGADRLRDGAKVALPGEDPAATAAANAAANPNANRGQGQRGRRGNGGNGGGRRGG